MKWILVLLVFLSACGETPKKRFQTGPQSDMGADDADTVRMDAGQEDASVDASADDGLVEGNPCAILRDFDIDFETVVVGNSATKIVRVENCSDTVPLTIDLTASAPLSLLADTQVQPGAVADIQIVFSPTTAGQFAKQ